VRATWAIFEEVIIAIVDMCWLLLQEHCLTVCCKIVVGGIDLEILINMEWIVS
jgi:hypothetical protein